MLGVLGGEAGDVVLHAGVPGGAEEAAGHGGAVHAEEVRLAGVLDVHQRHGPQQRLHELEGVVVRLVARQRGHDDRDAAPQDGLDRLAADEPTGQRHHLERRVLALVVLQQLLLRQALGPHVRLHFTRVDRH